MVRIEGPGRKRVKELMVLKRFVLRAFSLSIFHQTTPPRTLVFKYISNITVQVFKLPANFQFPFPQETLLY
jgi:hypothetical protein